MSRKEVYNLLAQSMPAMTVPKAAKELGKTKMTLYRWIDRGKVETVNVGGILFIRREEVERLKGAKSL